MKFHILEVKFTNNDTDDVLYPVVLQNKHDVILVDCGYAGFSPLIETAMNAHGLSLQNLTGIIITHHDIDHIGGLHEIKEKYPDIKIYAPEAEEPYISGKAKSLRLIQAENTHALLPENQRPAALQFQEFLKTVRPVEVDVTFSEGNLPFLDGVEIIHTPGHMPGHISLYLNHDKTLISADALVYENGELEIANPQYCLDLPQAVASVKKIIQYDVNKIICYHGGLVKHDIQSKLTTLLSKYL